ncbi:MAG TPA: pantetheine-phosphate adenylyltransferase [Bacteroidales bacterium]|nr:pantetheine-phosphate adenylyltransferase [Bacteroidales bacterium]
MNRIAVFPGSFDPVTLGHYNLVRRAIPLFDELVVAIGQNAYKQYFFSLEKRLDWLRQVFAPFPQVRIDCYEGLTVDYCKKLGAGYILRGLRTSADFEFERGIGQVNRMLCDSIETVFILTSPELTPVTSSIIRDIYRSGGDVSQFLPPGLELTI